MVLALVGSIEFQVNCRQMDTEPPRRPDAVSRFVVDGAKVAERNGARTRKQQPPGAVCIVRKHNPSREISSWQHEMSSSSAWTAGFRVAVSQQFRVGDSRNRPVTFQLTSRISTAITAGGTVGSAQTCIICCANWLAASAETRPSLRQHLPKADCTPSPRLRCRKLPREHDRSGRRTPACRGGPLRNCETG